MITVEINGLDKIVDMADKYPAVAQKHIDKAIQTSIFSIQKKVYDISPYITNTLRLSWIKGASFLPFYGKLENLANNKGFYYANALEFGTKRITPRHYLADSVSSNKDKIDQAFDKALTKIIQEI